MRLQCEFRMAHDQDNPVARWTLQGRRCAARPGRLQYMRKQFGAFSVHTYSLPDVAGGLGLQLIGLGVIGALAIVAVAWYLRRRGGRRKVPDETSDATPRRPRRRTKRKR